MSWTALQAAAAAIVVLYAALRLRADARPLRRAWLLAVVAVASWIGEDTVMRAYGFYAYADGWTLFVDRMPLLVALIWPVVIDSAWVLARRLFSRRFVPFAGAAIVLADASLIEPVAVHSGLWSWSEPGLFAVPPIGIVGWAVFAGFCMAFLERAEARPTRSGEDAAMLVAAPLATHAALVVLWWALFRWVNVTWPIALPLVVAWAVAPWIAWKSWHSRTNVPSDELFRRAPGAGFFFVLLAFRPDATLAAYVAAFALPYLALVVPAVRRPAVAPELP